MKKILILLTLLSTATIAFAQKSFEGEITYSVTVKLKDDTSKGVGIIIEHYYMKGDNYKIELGMDNSFWRIYLGTKKKIYSKSLLNDTIQCLDVTRDIDGDYKVKLKKNDTTILGYTCDKLTLTYSDRSRIYYFNSQFAVDPNLYINHKAGGLYAFFKKSKSVALKEVFQNGFSTSTRTALSIKQKNVDARMFELPPGFPISERPVKL